MAALASFGSGCDVPETSETNEDKDGCEASVSETDELYERFEATAYANACDDDDDCLASGCSGEVCSALNLDSTCEVLPHHPQGDCGCLDGQCVWYQCD